MKYKQRRRRGTHILKRFEIRSRHKRTENPRLRGETCGTPFIERLTQASPARGRACSREASRTVRSTLLLLLGLLHLLHAFCAVRDRLRWRRYLLRLFHEH